MEISNLSLLQLWMLQMLIYEKLFSNELLHNIYRRMPKSLQNEKPLNDIINEFEANEWVIKKEYGFEISSNLELQSELIFSTCQSKRLEWRSLLLNHVADYVEVPVSHPVRDSLFKIDRRFFMPQGKEYLADYDSPVSLKPGMTESAIHAVLMSIMPMQPKKGDQVLLCGAKGGLLASMLNDLVGATGKVAVLDWDVEIIEHCVNAVEKNISLQKKPEFILKPDITEGYPSGAPWNIIIVNGAVPKIPYDLIHQLDDDDGRILFFLASSNGSSQCLLIHKNKSIIQEEKLSKFRYTAIPGKFGYDDISQLHNQYQKSKDNLANELLLKIQQLTHYPVSKSFTSAFNARDPHERHMKILKVGECLIKYLAIIIISEIHEQITDNQKIGEIIRKLTNLPTNGVWLSALRDGISIGRKLKTSSMIAEDLDKKLKNTEIISAYELLLKETGSEKKSEIRQVKLSDFLSKFIEYRNKGGEGHRNVISISMAESNSNILIKAFSQILSDLNIFKNTDLVCVHSIERKGESDFVSVSQLTGNNFVNQRFLIPEDKMHLWYRKSNRTILTDKSHQEILIDIHPWIIWTDLGSNKDNELYLYNSCKSGNYDYITYHNPAVYPDPNIKDEFSKIVLKYPEPQLEINTSNQMFETIIKSLLGVFLLDMRIQESEMEQLINVTIQHGMSSNKEDAEQWIRNMIDRDYPGVYYGDE
jgi:protein-L-isoaspartate(D-aspartate) O-methyltransferase